LTRIDRLLFVVGPVGKPEACPQIHTVGRPAASGGQQGTMGERAAAGPVSGEAARAVEDRQCAARVVVDPDPRLDEVRPYRGRRDLQAEAANRFLRETYLPDHNARFAVPPEHPETAFVADLAGVHRDILCVQEERVVGNDNTVRYRGLDRGSAGELELLGGCRRHAGFGRVGRDVLDAELREVLASGRRRSGTSPLPH
jgi:hypothetical protein